MEEHQDIISDLYQAFACYERPEHFTDYKHCEECNEHDETMRSANLQTLTGYDIGTGGWNPLCFLTVEGFAHYMPRIMELAITGAKNKHDESVLSVLLFHLAPSDDYDRFSSYSIVQCEAVLAALKYAFTKHRNEIVEEFIQDDIEAAISYWEQQKGNG